MRIRLLLLRFELAVLLLPVGLDAEPVKFAVIGDFGKGAVGHHVNELISSWGPQFVITVGDNSYKRDDQAPSSYKNAFEWEVGVPFGTFISQGNFFPSLGNHDFKASGDGVTPGRLDQYLDTLKPPRNGQGNGRYYDFVKGSVHFFALNSNKGSELEPDGVRFYEKQGDWLRDKLAAATEPFKVVYFHHPPYSTSPQHHGSTLEMRWPFKEWGASLVLSGHQHNYERFERRGLNYVINGLGGNSYYELPDNGKIDGLKRHAAYPKASDPTRQFGALLIEVDDQATKMEIAAFTISNVSPLQVVKRDQFTISAIAPMPAPIYRDLNIMLASKEAADVAAWQDFLVERNLLANKPDGRFGQKSQAATKLFQQQQNLPQTGVFDAVTREHARGLGFKPVEDPTPN